MTEVDPAPTAVFVYGTLKPGHCRWPLVAPFVDHHHAATVPGRLWDTRRDFPAACFEGPAEGATEEEVHGEVLVLRPGRVTAALEVLDLVEGTEYRRTRVLASDGTTCWTYEWDRTTAGLTPVPDGRWIGV